MDPKKKMLPIGYDDFAAIRKDDFYYVDKTGLIRELMKNRANVTLFTRPRRFGKSLNMSMLANFFSVEGDKSIFDGLEISSETELCEKYMGKYPVIFLTLKKIDADNYETAFGRAVQLIKAVAKKFEFLEQSDKLNDDDKTEYGMLKDLSMSENTFMGSLLTLSRLLEKHYGRKAVLLVDEYDVPLAKANENGYYDRMITLIRGFLGDALKTNESLEFAVLTGCLRVSKESIFTGLNNLMTLSVSARICDECFGFTDTEVRTLLKYYDLSDHYEEIKDWYDGYKFGNTNVYCPWDVINQCRFLQANPKEKPLNHWINSSGNYAVQRFVEMADGVTKKELEALVAGGSVRKNLREDLTYSEIYEDIDNLWSLLYMTGYLTKRRSADDDQSKPTIPNNASAERVAADDGIIAPAVPNDEIRSYVVSDDDLSEFTATSNETAERDSEIRELSSSGAVLPESAISDNYHYEFDDTDDDLTELVIPNKEIRDVYVKKILAWFKEGVREDGKTLKSFCDALDSGDAETAEKILTQYLRRTISILDTDAPDGRKEKFYHGLLLGILGVKETWRTTSNRESGEGFADIIIVPEEGDHGIVIEVKYAPDGQLDRYAKAALEQITSRDYAAVLYDEGVDRVIEYGVAFYKKRCRVVTSDS